MDRSPGAGISPGLQIAVITAVAATLGIVAGGALVYLQQRRSGSEQDRRCKSAQASSRTDSLNAAVPLFDSVQVSVLLCRTARSIWRWQHVAAAAQ